MEGFLALGSFAFFVLAAVLGAGFSPAGSAGAESFTVSSTKAKVSSAAMATASQANEMAEETIRVQRGKQGRESSKRPGVQVRGENRKGGDEI